MHARRIISAIALFCLMAGANLNLSAAEAYILDFRIGKSTIDSSYKYNTRASARMLEAFASQSEPVITVTAFSSPDGKFSRNRQLAVLRAASVKDFIISNLSSPERCTINTVVIPEDWEGVKRYLKRSSLEWKEDALAILDSKEGDKKALLQDLWVGEAWEDLLKNCFPALRRVSVSIEKPVTDAPVADSSDVELIFNCGSSALRNGDSLKALAKSAAPTLYIYVKASPEGQAAANEKLSLKRAERVKAKLLALGYSGEVIPVYEGEDWEGLATVVRESSDVPDKEAVLDILADSSMDRDARKHALQALSYGRTWLRLMDQEMAGLRKATVTPDKH